MPLGAFYSVMRLSRQRRDRERRRRNTTDAHFDACGWGKINPTKAHIEARHTLDIEIEEMKKRHAPVERQPVNKSRVVIIIILSTIAFMYLLNWALHR